MGGPNISKMLAKAKAVYEDIHDQWLASDEIGVDVKLYYPASYVDCTNCQHSDWGNTYKAGGPAPFNLGSCPMCGGSCKQENEVNELIKMRVYSIRPNDFSNRSFKKMGISIQSPAGDLLSIGSMTDMSKILNCNYAVFYSNVEEIIGSQRFKLDGEPRPHGFGKTTYFYCFWNRV